MALSTGGPLILVIGRVCAGKTTFGNRLAEQHDYLHIEASDEMHLIVDGSRSKNHDKAFCRAKKLLRDQGPDVVARGICEKYQELLETGAVITGFRTIEEVMYFRIRYPSCVVIFVNSGDRTRFYRHWRRGRLDMIKTFSEFQKYDRQQWEFGLLSNAHQIVDVPREIADYELTNEGRIEEYYTQVDSIVKRLGNPIARKGRDELILGVPGLIRSNVDALQKRRTFRCLQVLLESSSPMTCSEIRKMMVNSGIDHGISDRHVNWVLSNLPTLARRLVNGSRLRYEILPAGRAYVEYVKIQSANR